MKLYIAIVLSLVTLTMQGQQVVYNFDDCSLDEVNGSWPAGTTSSLPNCECGVVANGLYFNGNQDNITFDEDLDSLLVNDYTISFYFRIDQATSNTDIFSVSATCGFDSTLALTYEPVTNAMSLQLGNNITSLSTIKAPLNPSLCWHRFVVTKSGLLYTMYLDGLAVGNFVAPSTLVYPKRARMAFANSPCLAISEDRFNGWLDQFEIYTRALSSVELGANDLRVDQIITNDTTIVQGESVSVFVGPTCATNWTWAPTATIDDPSELDIIVTPEMTTRYSLQLNNTGGCQTTDTVTVFVIDEDALDCEALLLPNAFTPNGDQLNDDYGISNLFLVDDIEFFEIYDRWGAKVFETNQKDGRWDGSFAGTSVNPGMFIYKIKYTCKGDEFVKVDNFSVLR